MIWIVTVLNVRIGTVVATISDDADAVTEELAMKRRKPKTKHPVMKTRPVQVAVVVAGMMKVARVALVGAAMETIIRTERTRKAAVTLRLRP